MAKKTQGPPSDLAMSIQEEQLREAMREKLRREREALRLYEPLPYQDVFHRSKAMEVVLQKGNRAGGSMAGFIEVARAVTGQDPYDKYPKENGTAICLGYGENHIGRVIFKYLFMPGAFDIIKDLKTGKWRTYRPWEPEDAAREKEKRAAPPLIPERYIVPKSICWEKKAGKVFSRVEFKTGWTLYAGNSAGDPSQFQGFNVNLYHIDEDLATEGWYQEALGRVAAVSGLIRWTALPHSQNNELMDLIDRAEKSAGEENPQAVAIKASIFQNKFLPKESVERTVNAWKAQGDDIYRKRAMGELVIDSIKMYPTFSRLYHGAISTDPGISKVREEFTKSGGEPPDNWTRYMFVDPGNTVCAAILIATPPPEIGRQPVVYRELYIKGADAREFGRQAKRAMGEKVFQEFRIDMHGARLRHIGTSELPLGFYVKALEENGLRCEVFGSAFGAGFDDIERREEATRLWLGSGDDGEPGVYVALEQCPMFCWEIERFRKITVKKGDQNLPTDKGNRRLHTHAVECFEMAAAHGCPYVPVPKRSVGGTAWIDIYLAAQERKQQAATRNAELRGADSGIYLGMGGSTAPSATGVS